MEWQIQEAKQRFSELVRRADSDGPQVVTRHGHEVVIVISANDYRRIRPGHGDFKDFLRSGPDMDRLELARDTRLASPIDLPSIPQTT